jgi:membrane dipeptidase
MASPTVAVFDGHNDVLLRLHDAGAPESAFVHGAPDRQVDLPRARKGGLAGGLFAMFTPAPDGASRMVVAQGDDGSWSIPDFEPIAPDLAIATATAMTERARRLAAASDGAVEVIEDVAALDRCLGEGRLALVLHLEGGEAIVEGHADLEAWYARGIRSVGPVWSRPNAYGHGVPLRFPGDPDIGPGLTAAGVRLIRRCNELSVLVDVSHLNEAGFWDVARTASAPFVASHSGVHALCPAPRNLTDPQLRALADAGGLVGVIFHPAFTRADGRDDSSTPVSVIAEHVRHVADLVGVDHVALGSDFEGAPMPTAVGSAAGLPAVIDALGEIGFDRAEVQQIAWGNWRRVLGAVWRS